MDNRFWILGLVACLFFSCAQREGTQHNQASIKVQTIVVTSQETSATSRYVGTIEPAQETPLSLQTTGRVVAVHVKNGQRVKAGQAILDVDNTQALNALHGAEAALKHAQDGYDRVSKVHDKGVVSDQKMVEIESDLAQARSLYNGAKQQLAECTLKAPCEGVISGLEAVIGQTIIPGTTLCKLLDVSGFSVRFTVPESEINGLGKSGTVECAAVNKVLPITLKETGIVANTVTHTYDVVARIQGGADILKTGMVAIVKITNHPYLQIVPSGKESPITNNSIVIPAKCILLKPEGHTVWVVEEGKAVRRSITIDGYQADGVRVLSGLQEGDILITEGYQKLYNNCSIENE